MKAIFAEYTKTDRRLDLVRVLWFAHKWPVPSFFFSRREEGLKKKHLRVTTVPTSWTLRLVRVK